ncbi:cyclic peptide export ABC transporter [Shimia biformata]|uniref:cyclic peptide export ABC transporter n=1 Tax=Shimia biformata TaxID=1294299 RepID=UPI001952791F|nr:cyclic peptide export ABC transporter [Shimia biformata]
MTSSTTRTEEDSRGFGGFVRRRRKILRYLLVTSGALKDPVILFTLVASLGRSGLILAINTIVANLDTDARWPFLLLAVSAVAMLLASYQARVRSFVMMTRITADMRQSMSVALLHANIDFLLSRDHGAIYAGITHQVREVNNALVTVIQAIEAVIIVLVAIPYLFWISPVAGLMTLGAVLIGTLAYVLLDVPARKMAKRANRAHAEFCGRVDDLLSGWKEIRLSNPRRLAMEEEVARVVAKANHYSLESERLFSASTVIAQSALILLMCAVVAVLPFLTGASPATLLQILTVVLLTSGPIESLFDALPKLSRAEAAYSQIEELQASLMRAQSRSLTEGQEGHRSFSSIELRGVEAVIRDPDRPEHEAFRLGPVDMSFAPGETVFICGGNGSGKTTLMSLITGLRHPDAGTILLDGKPLTPETIAAYRELFSGVFSLFHLFDRAYGLGDLELAELDRRIAQLNLSHRVHLAEDRFSSLSLSAGQRRRLALAVTLAEGRPIVVLDEFAADQDPGNRAFFYDVLLPELAADGKLIIAVTHDDHQFEKCDRLIKMSAGKVESETPMRAGRPGVRA